MIRKLKAYLLKNIFKSVYKPGSYYSTVPNLKDVKERYDRIFVNRSPESLGGMHLAKEEMARLLKDGKSILGQYSFPENKSPDFRYYSQNIFFNKSDSLALFLIIKKFGPKKIIEVGSGFSSAVMLDIRDKFYNGQPLSLTFIEPYTERLYSLLSKDDHSKSVIRQSIVQEVPLSVFKELQENDILFIDSSHVSKIGSDLNFLLFEVLPQLNKGVIIHFHDIFYPFEYPYQWIEQGISWNEAYLLRAFLMFNDSFQVVLFNSLITNDPVLSVAYPELTVGGSIYLRKMK
jgi:predicted O-methyltransferase YrrM